MLNYYWSLCVWHNIFLYGTAYRRCVDIDSSLIFREENPYMSPNQIAVSRIVEQLGTYVLSLFCHNFLGIYFMYYAIFSTLESQRHIVFRVHLHWRRVKANFYRPQRSCEGYAFTRVCLSTGEGEYLDRYPLGPGTPQDQVNPPGTGTPPPDQVHPIRTRYTPIPGPGTPHRRFLSLSGTLNWILYELILKQCSFHLRSNINESLVLNILT